jgi:MFS family permease
MTTQSPVSHAAGLYLAVVQLFFTLCWTVYAIYLPKLAGGVGIPASAVILILMMDQAIFTIVDVATGVAADRVSRVVGKLGRIVAIATVVSCIGFVALPFISGASTLNIAIFLAATIIWTVTSSALRAPPIMLLGKYAAKPALPYLSSLTLLGLGLAGAAAPYLALILRDEDPRIPFVLASVVLLLATFGLAHVERSLAKQKPSGISPPAKLATPISTTRVVFAIAMVVLALGYQIHFALNTEPLFKRFTTDPVDIAHLMPLFWVGFNVAMFPATLLVKRWGGFAVMGVFGVIGALAVVAAEAAGALNFLIVAQLAAGASWGCILMAAFMAAFNTGEGGAEGKMVGVLFSALAFATFLRMGAIAAGLNKDAAWTPLLTWAPVTLWAIAGAALIWLAFGYIRRWMARPV